MPELPEVETTRTSLQGFVGKTLTHIDVHNGNLRWAVPNTVYNVVHQNLTAIHRRAKYLLFQFSDQRQLMIHLGMSGSLTPQSAQLPLRKHDHVVLHFNNEQIRFHDPRRFGSVFYLEQAFEHTLLAKLGPEPLTEAFNVDYLVQKLISKKCAIKVAIMDNHIVVGVGNIYATEALFHAGIHPQTPANQVVYEQLAVLVQHIKRILALAIKVGGSTLRDYTYGQGENGYFQQQLWAYGRSGQLCKQCDTKLDSIRIGQRASVFCPLCQK